eukprot:2953866-Prymnesium_polylepis.1
MRVPPDVAGSIAGSPPEGDDAAATAFKWARQIEQLALGAQVEDELWPAAAPLFAVATALRAEVEHETLLIADAFA